MNYRIKTFFFKFLEVLPEQLGYSVYHGVQNLLKSHNVTRSINNHHGTLKRFTKELKLLGVDFVDKVILEIGSGWAPFTPYLLLAEFKAKKVITFDIHEHYQKNMIVELNKLYAKQLEVRDLEQLNKRVEYIPCTNIIRNAPPVPVNIIMSRNVLEHIPPEDILAIHKEAHQYLSGDSIIIHQISPSDHRAYSDKTLSLWDFLKYSQSEWDKVQTKFDYHNRLRLPQYLQIFKEAGFKILKVDYDFKTNPALLPSFIHKDFREFSNEELTAGNILIILST